MSGNGKLERLEAGMPIVFGGDRVTRVSAELAKAFSSGDRLIVLQTTGDLLRVPHAAHRTSARAVDRAVEAFAAMARVGDDRISAFFEAFAARLASAEAWAEIAKANAQDVERARARGASVTRLLASEAMRQDMIDGLRAWRDAPAGRGRLVERHEHDGWSVELATAPLGVVGFVFEGRPNVFADAAGVLRGRNTVAFRIGSDALGTARALSEHTLAPALQEAGLPEGAAVLIDSAEHAAGWAMFADPRLSLAVARGSGRAVAQLGAVARQAGTPVSLHGTGGAWMMADAGADADRFEAAVLASLDRKVCNTLNVCCIVRSRAEELTPRFLAALEAAGARRGHGVKLHVAAGSEAWLPQSWRTARSIVRRADGDHEEPKAELLPVEELGVEWEWEESPEVSLAIVESLDEAVRLFNRHSPRFIASVISEDEAAKSAAFDALEAAFIGDGFTRWVDGQYALQRPELGLSNWQSGRLFARGGVLSGDGVFTVRTRMSQQDAHLRR
ncbi:MAG TPA: aldehyde dehydrogenase family protein [Caulobacteraceae bacterium]|jgi:glutamate-5-semialdehyde dehydrogenase|nr:aldehyde dehydrogenase family protein [Caulobacteraceae bacterium]